ncbi:MAG: 50S ribosomal protein L25 [Armatimonadota bacterium]|nr:50S ribosomal protein L25 [Armatimonadota bacterium]
MANLKLVANYRSDMSKSHLKKIRREGYVTGSVFGRGIDPIPIEVSLKDLVNQIKSSEHGMMSLFDLEIKGAPKDGKHTVIIKEFFRDPITRKVLDIQFQRVSLTEKVHVDVPIELVGDSEGVKKGGIVEQLLDELAVRALPTNIPPKIEVDISSLDIGDHIRVADIKAPEGVEILTDGETIVCTCVPPHVRHEEAAPAEEKAEEAPAAEKEKAPAGESE